MKTDIQFKVDILKTLITEDRQEIRDIRSAIYNRSYILTASSFALLSFLFKDNELSPARVQICFITDLVIILLLWILFFRHKRDLYHTRQCLEAREELINGLDEMNTNDLNVFPDARKLADGTKRIPRIQDPEIIWIPVLSTAAILINMGIIFFI
jgi:hypothetical protein